MLRKNMPYNKNIRRKSTLERLTIQLTKYGPEDEKKRAKCKKDIDTLKKRIILDTEALGIRTKKNRSAFAKVRR